MKNKKITLTIGIPAHNEENTITHLLNDILGQNTRNYTLKKILVILDKPIDNTEKVLKAFFKNKKIISVISDNKRVGKCQRLNQIYALNKSEVVLTLDADIVLQNQDVIDNMVKHFNDKKVGLVAANDFPFEMRNFAQKVIGRWFMMWYRIRADFNHGDTLFNVHGVAQALSCEFARQVHYPKGITADQDYLYLSLKKSNFTFKHAKDAIVSFYLPKTLGEYYFQTSRFLSEKDPLREEFGDFANQFYTIPRTYKVRKIIENFFHDPIYTVLGLIMYAKFLLPTEIDPLNKLGMWEQIPSTKGPLETLLSNVQQ